MVRIVGDWFGMLGFVLPSFDTPDSLAEQYPHLSPYAHCAANPLMYVDSDGRASFWSKGKVNQRDGSFGYHLL